MKNWAFLALVIAGFFIWYILQTRESFVPEFLEQSGVQRTADTASSSYSQQTNHMQKGTYQMEPIDGIETPFRVNMYTSYAT
jgi:hypothetical protein